MGEMTDRPPLPEDWLPVWIGRTGDGNCYRVHYRRTHDSVHGRMLFLSEIKQALAHPRRTLAAIKAAGQLERFDFGPYRATNSYIMWDEATGTLADVTQGQPRRELLRRLAGHHTNPEQRIKAYDQAALLALADAFGLVYRLLHGAGETA